MNAVGIIAEYNPFHNGHLYHLQQVKKVCPDSVIIIVLGGPFMQRGETSIINKWDKTKIALHYGADIVIELPFPFATQAADIFAKGSIQILNHMQVKTLIFGSESNDINKLIDIAKVSINNKQLENKIKDFLNEGISYPKALANSLSSLNNHTLDTPNDILGVCYIKEILKQKAKIKPLAIQRTNDYHDLSINNKVVSASSIRKALKEGKDIKEQVPSEVYQYLTNKLFFIEDYFSLLKYQILVNINELNKFQTVDEGLENRIKKYIINATSLEDLINKVKTKRYTYNKIRRMLTHILNGFTKDQAKESKDVKYLRVLGFSNEGQKYLNQIKKILDIPLVTKIKQDNFSLLELDIKATTIYASVLEETDKIKLIEQEYKSFPIIKK